MNKSEFMCNADQSPSYGLGYTLAKMNIYKKSDTYKEKLNKCPWTLHEGANIVNRAQPFAHSCGYFLCLSGGVLKGASYNDLDILAMYGPNETEFKIDFLVHYLMTEFKWQEIGRKTLNGLDVIHFEEANTEAKRKVDLLIVQK